MLVSQVVPSKHVRHCRVLAQVLQIETVVDEIAGSSSRYTPRVIESSPPTIPADFPLRRVNAGWSRDVPSSPDPRSPGVRCPTGFEKKLPPAFSPPPLPAPLNPLGHSLPPASGPRFFGLAVAQDKARFLPNSSKPHRRYNSAMSMAHEFLIASCGRGARIIPHATHPLSPRNKTG